MNNTCVIRRENGFASAFMVAGAAEPAGYARPAVRADAQRCGDPSELELASRPIMADAAGDIEIIRRAAIARRGALEPGSTPWSGTPIHTAHPVLA
jgi:hypothetical protein